MLIGDSQGFLHRFDGSLQRWHPPEKKCSCHCILQMNTNGYRPEVTVSETRNFFSFHYEFYQKLDSKVIIVKYLYLPWVRGELQIPL